MKNGEKLRRYMLIIPSFIIGVIATGAIVWQTTGVNASNGNGYGDKMAEQLAEKLNISENQVTGAMDQIHTEREANRQAEIAENLDQAVGDGVITEEQKQSIIAKQAEIKARMEAERTEMQTWMEENGIDEEALHEYNIGGFGFGGGKGMRGEGAR